MNSLLIPLHIRNLNGRTSGNKQSTAGTAASSQSSSSVSSSGGNSASNLNNNTTSSSEPITSTQDLNTSINENREATPTSNA